MEQGYRYCSSPLLRDRGDEDESVKMTKEWFAKQEENKENAMSYNQVKKAFQGRVSAQLVLFQAEYEEITANHLVQFNSRVPGCQVNLNLEYVIYNFSRNTSPCPLSPPKNIHFKISTLTLLVLSHQICSNYFLLKLLG